MNAITSVWKQILKLFQTKLPVCHKDKLADGKEKETERKQPVRLTQEVRAFLQKQYDFRYNLLTEETEYRPFRLYMEELPDWDGTDRLESLARRVSDHPLWVTSFHTWMLALTAQWLGMTGIHANSVAPILVSSEQARKDVLHLAVAVPFFQILFFT